jgi:hypothetical protein
MLSLTIISVLLLVPCFWHRRIAAGDLASHTYNAWLAHLVHQGKAPGLYLVWRWDNVLADVALERLGALLGFIVAERIVVAISVLLFFWGAFALISAATARAPWSLIPAIAMVTYGWTFYAGFLNFYLSLGLAFFGAALLWRGSETELLLVPVLAFVTLLAHPMGFFCLLGMGLYFRAGEHLQGLARWGLLACALLLLFGLRYYALHLGSQVWLTRSFLFMNGADQLAVFGQHYRKLAAATAVFVGLFFCAGILTEKPSGAALPALRSSLEMWLLLIFAAALLPQDWPFPQFAMPVSSAISRLTAATAVLGLCVAGFVRPKMWQTAGLAVSATLFFAWTYQDTNILNNMERQVDVMVDALPYGRRVVETIDPPEGSRALFNNHMVDRACIGKCFAFDNYEAASRAFRIRVRHASPIVTDSVSDSEDMQGGSYVVRAEDLPMNQIYQCDARDLSKLCIRELSQGEENGPGGSVLTR